MDFLFPRHCLGCGKEGEYFCPSCRPRLPRIGSPYCARCGYPLIFEPCPFCRGKRFSFEGLRSVFRFEGLVREAIHRLKYQNLKTLAPELGWFLAEYLKHHPVPAEAVVPVPLHPKRLRERGYNQAELLAREMSQATGLRLVTGCLVRHRHSLPQVNQASAEGRWLNVADAFLCRSEELRGVRVLLLDDVCTTGATLDACARALKDGGALGVWALTLAREV